MRAYRIHLSSNVNVWLSLHLDIITWQCICCVNAEVPSFSSSCFGHIIPRQKILTIVEELAGWSHYLSMMEQWREKFPLLPGIEIIAILRSPNSYPYFEWDCTILVLCDYKLTLLPKMLFLCSTKVCVGCFMLSATSGLPYLHSYSGTCGSPSLAICGSILVEVRECLSNR
jgi:hypothetical protein